MLANDACNIKKNIKKKKKSQSCHSHIGPIFKRKPFITKSYTDTHPCRSRAKPTNKQTNKHATTQEVEQEERKSVK
jgi:hypothetical protein